MNEWRDIDSAPKDGTPALLFAGLFTRNGVMAPTRVVGYFLDEHGWVAQSYEGQSIAQLSPLKWTPLPDFPR